MSWTDERVETLKKLWLDGLSASQIAAQLGGVTRNAVIGKVHRLGLSGRVKKPSSAPRAPRKPRTNTSANKAAPRRGPSSGGSSGGSVMGNVALQQAPAASVDLRAREDVVVPMSRELSLIQLTETTCKWPSGDPTSDDFSFCGHSTKDDAPYCEHHAKLAYQPSSKRRA